MMNKVIHGNCLEVLKGMADNSVDSIVTDPPYGLAFMGKKWDYDVPSEDIWRECLRVLKPGGHLLAFAGTRTQHRMAVRIEDAGFEIRDMIMWVYGCLSDDTEILTEDGWERYDIAKESSVFTDKKILTYDVKSDIYKWEKPERWNEYRVDQDIAFRIHSDTTDQIVSRGHRCLVERSGKLFFEPADELFIFERVPILPSNFDGISEDGSQKASYQTTLATVTAFNYSGVIFCPTVSTGAFVARRNGKVFITGNSGFPKSLDVSKAIDKSAGAEREVVGSYEVTRDMSGGSWAGLHGKPNNAKQHDITAPATPEAQQWQGWGSSLKPALEPITVARKPFKGTLAENVLEWGTGGINVDGCRVGTGDGRPLIESKSEASLNAFGNGLNGSRCAGVTTQGRWPANLIHDGSDEVVGMFPETGKTPSPYFQKSTSVGTVNVSAEKQHDRLSTHHGDSGSAARFFYRAKASRAERNAGLGDAPNGHPTVKPISLMRYLVRLVTPPNGIVLDPFGGSGSTACGAVMEGMPFVTIEREAEYIPIIEARVAHWTAEAEAEAKEKKKADNQLSLF